MGDPGDHDVEGRLTISHLDEAPRVARRFAKKTVADVLDADAAETLELLVSELVCGALAAGDTTLELSVLVRPEVVRIELLDTAGLPSVRTVPTEVDRFRAAILARLSDGTGAHMTDDGCRHWLELRRRPRSRR